jgi:hypothetical protein
LREGGHQDEAIIRISEAKVCTKRQTKKGTQLNEKFNDTCISSAGENNKTSL